MFRLQTKMSELNLLPNQYGCRARHPYKLILFGVIATTIFFVYTYTNQRSEDTQSRNVIQLNGRLKNFFLNHAQNKYETKITSNEPKHNKRFKKPLFNFTFDGFRYPIYTDEELNKIDAAKKCYEIDESGADDIKWLDDIEKIPPKPDKSIFFIDITCLGSKRVTLNAR